MTSETSGAGQVTGYTYDADGDVATIVYPLPAAATWATSSTVTFSYYTQGSLSAVTDFNGHKISITDDADSQPMVDTLSTTGDKLSTTYDATGVAASISLSNSGSTLQSFSYSDAPAGNILQEADTPVSSNSPAVYTYDALSRVKSMTPGSNPAHSYGFDASGNLAALPTGATGSYDHDSELTASALSGSTTSYTYNPDGERLGASLAGSSISAGTWNGAGQLKSYSDPSANMTAAAYDGNGYRTSTSATPAGQPNIPQSYVWAGDSLIMDSTNAYIYDGGNSPAEQVNLTSGAITYLVPDLLGSIRGTVGSTGTLSGTTSYDAWGNPSSTGGLTGSTPFGFAGSYTDPTGLIYLVNRYYDPSAGQFVSMDPDVDQTNQPYAYAAGDPVAETDPTGLNTINLRAVSTWAYTHWNNSYEWFGDDCTDFASNALAAGGMQQVTSFGNKSATDDRNWFFSPPVPRVRPMQWSHSWSVAHDLAVHLTDYGASWIYGYNSPEIQDGDLIFADWKSPSYGGISHVGVITGIQGNGMPYITQHTRDIRNETLQYWLQHGGPNVHCWIMRPNQTYLQG
jgi:RHS repeat-associated protein